MPQIHLYVPQTIADEVKRRAGRLGLSVSQYLALLVRREVADEWPDGFFDDVAGYLARRAARAAVPAPSGRARGTPDDCRHCETRAKRSGRGVPAPPAFPTPAAP